MEKIPLYKVEFTPKKTPTATELSLEEGFEGIYGISLVETPATGLNFIALSKEKEPVQLSTVNKEQRLLLGAVLVPNQKIYRKGGFELYFDEETIKLASQEFFKNGYHTNSTIEHKGEMIDGVSFVESWIVEDIEKDKAALHGFDVPVGTWMVAMKVDSDIIWNDYVKTGKVKGFSIDSLFNLQKIEMNINKNTKMKKTNILEKIKAILLADSAMDVSYLEIEIDGIGKLYAEDFSLDFVVYTEDADGVKQPYVDATFEYEGKQFKTDAEGKIVEITDVTTEQTPVADVAVQLAEAQKLVEELKSKLSVKMSEELWKFTAEDGKDYFTSWLNLGEIVTDSDKALVVSATFEFEGKVYTTDEKGEINSVTKNPESPYWAPDYMAVDMASQEEIDAMKAEIESLKQQLADKEAELEKATTQVAMLKEKPAATKLSVNTKLSKETKPSRFDFLRNLDKK